jgi:hypothetical protein
MPDTAIDALKQATKGLKYQSESDAPFKTFVWKDRGRLTKQKVLELSGHQPGTPIEEVKLADFFADLTEEQDWHGADEKKTVERYKNLLKTIKDNLSGAKVYKVGDVNRDIYIVGKTPAGDWAGVQTKAVET